MDHLPVVSLEAALSGDPTAVAVEIDAALSKVGFFTIRDHGVPPAVIDAAMADTDRFFDLPTPKSIKLFRRGLGR